jgi:hypothetical protein
MNSNFRIPLASIVTPTSIAIFLRNKTLSMDSTNPLFHRLLTLIKPGEVSAIDLAEIETIFDLNKFVTRHTNGRVTLSDDAVMLDGVRVNNVIAVRLLQMVKDGFKIDGMCRFLENLQENPSSATREQLYLWLEESSLPITADGMFLAYKKIDDDYSSYHRGPNGTKIYNRVGDKPSMPREEVDPDRNTTCSQGLHFCAYSYLPHYMGTSGRVMVVKINPADVVAIPNDYNNAKGRAWTYEIVGEVAPKDAEFAFKDVSLTNQYGTYDDSATDISSPYEDYDLDDYDFADNNFALFDGDPDDATKPCSEHECDADEYGADGWALDPNGNDHVVLVDNHGLRWSVAEVMNFYGDNNAGIEGILTAIDTNVADAKAAVKKARIYLAEHAKI